MAISLSLCLKLLAYVVCWVYVFCLIEYCCIGPSEPPNIALIIPAARNLTVHWDDVPTSSQNGDITFIEICYNSSTFETVTKCVNASGGSNAEVIDGLEEFVVYDIRIRAYTIVGPSDFSASERNRTLAGTLCISVSKLMTVFVNCSSEWSTN